MNMKIIDKKGKRQLILVPDKEWEKEIFDNLKDHQVCSMIIRKGKFTEDLGTQRSVLIISDNHKKTEEITSNEGNNEKE